MLQTRYTHKPFKGEEMDIVGKQRSKVERAGYISTNMRIKAILQSGRQLKQWREEQFDFKTEREIEDAYFNPLSYKTLDKMDIIDLGRSAEARLKASQINQNQREKASEEEREESITKEVKVDSEKNDGVSE